MLGDFGVPILLLMSASGFGTYRESEYIGNLVEVRALPGAQKRVTRDLSLWGGELPIGTWATPVHCLPAASGRRKDRPKKVEVADLPRKRAILGR